jgi:16S rRNA processing protein RimM
VRGWVRITPHSPLAEVLLSTRSWWLLGAQAARRLQVSATRRQGASLVAKWDGCDSREAAEALKGTAVAVARSEFPQLSGQQYYWVDLIGLRVINRSQRALGVVTGLRSSAAHDLLEIGPDVREQEVRGHEILVPVVGEYIDGIDLDAGTIRVNWEPEWLA